MNCFSKILCITLMGLSLVTTSQAKDISYHEITVCNYGTGSGVKKPRDIKIFFQTSHRIHGPWYSSLYTVPLRSCMKMYLYVQPVETVNHKSPRYHLFVTVQRPFFALHKKLTFIFDKNIGSDPQINLLQNSSGRNFTMSFNTVGLKTA